MGAMKRCQYCGNRGQVVDYDDHLETCEVRRKFWHQVMIAAAAQSKGSTENTAYWGVTVADELVYALDRTFELEVKK